MQRPHSYVTKVCSTTCRRAVVPEPLQECSSSHTLPLLLYTPLFHRESAERVTDPGAYQREGDHASKPQFTLPDMRVTWGRLSCCAMPQVIQLYDTMDVRFGVMLVGPTGGGKTQCYRTLQVSLLPGCQNSLEPLPEDQVLSSSQSSNAGIQLRNETRERSSHDMT